MMTKRSKSNSIVSSRVKEAKRLSRSLKLKLQVTIKLRRRVLLRRLMLKGCLINWITEMLEVLRMKVTAIAAKMMSQLSNFKWKMTLMLTSSQNFKKTIWMNRRQTKLQVFLKLAHHKRRQCKGQGDRVDHPSLPKKMIKCKMIIDLNFKSYDLKNYFINVISFIFTKARPKTAADHFLSMWDHKYKVPKQCAELDTYKDEQ